MIMIIICRDDLPRPGLERRRFPASLSIAWHPASYVNP
jgi:hypothetical protein